MLRVQLALWCLVAIAAAPAQAIDGGPGVAQVTGTHGTPPANQPSGLRYVGALGVEVGDRPSVSAMVLRQR